MSAHEALHAAIVDRCEQIERMFERPDDVRVAVIVRTPWLEDGGVLVSSDTEAEAAAELRRLWARPVVAGEPQR